ncbi:GntR family transcriptional regulator [Paenirhodobacter enshiensis]|uniref:GntR family transcriptional regulator n=1 Tax=Paenirhodobacter enshiensis TaxID=1105367 RepID=UPI0035AF740C
MLQPQDKRLALQAYEQILDLIQSKRAQPGEIVTERRLAEMLDMSRTPIRDALLMLEGEGLLIRRGTRGLQVKQIRIEDFMDALQIRSLLEPAMARMAAGRIPAGDLDSLRNQLQTLAAGGENDRMSVREVDERLHEMIARAAGNPQLEQIIRTVCRQTQMFDLRSMPERLGDTCAEHIAIVDAIASGNAEASAKAMADHLSAVRRAIVARLTGG